VITPTGQPWPGVMGQFMAASAVMSPFSDGSQPERLLPHNLLQSDPDSHASFVSDGVPREEEKTQSASVPFQGTDDRWVCIPSGIVERYKTQFESPGIVDGVIEAPAPAMTPDVTTVAMEIGTEIQCARMEHAVGGMNTRMESSGAQHQEQ